MRRSPRTRRLMSDHRAVQQLARESSIFHFEAKGTPPEAYRLIFKGLGVWRPNPHQAALCDEHVVIVELGAAYPRLIPGLTWQTPIFHPNISSGGVVCLGGYGTHWVPSLTLDELCVMLWDMIRFKNYDPESPYNREAALWAKSQTQFTLPVDDRPLRNLVSRSNNYQGHRATAHANEKRPPIIVQVDKSGVELIDAEAVDRSRDSLPGSGDADVVFID